MTDIEIRRTASDDVPATAVLLADDDLGRRAKLPASWRPTSRRSTSPTPTRRSHIVSWAAARARQYGCRMVKLTSSAARQRAHRCYEQLDFETSHAGYPLTLDGGGP